MIIGNGIAGLSAAKEIRNNDKEGSLTIISAEAYLTYYRVKLSRVLASKLNEDSLLVNKEEWYKDNNIDVILNSVVQRIDIEKKQVLLQDGRIYSYDKLLIATGSRPFIPLIEGSDKNGVFALRTLDDVERVQIHCIGCDTYTVLGGGLLGLEAAWSLKELGRKVNVIEFAPYLLSIQIDEEIANKLKEKFKGHGINIYTSSVAKEIIGDDIISGLKINDGEIIETNGILISAGVRPNLDLVMNTPIEYDKGIKVDLHLKTNVDNIYAAGDVIEIDGRPVGLWTAGNEQGKIAGSNMVGGDKTYTQAKLFANLKIGDIEIFSAGDITNYDAIYEYIDEEKDIHHKLFVLDKKIMGVILYGDLKQMSNLKNATISNMDIEEYLKTGLPFKLSNK